MRKAYKACNPKLMGTRTEVARTITANDEESTVRIDLQPTHGQVQSRFSALPLEIRDQLYHMNDTAAHAEKSIIRVDPQLIHDKPRITFLTLPQEIRDQIYYEVLCDTSVRYKRPYATKWACFPWLEDSEGKPRWPPLLRVCRSMKSEIDSSWMRIVTFSFSDPITLLDVLMPIQPHKFSLIRKLDIDAGKLPHDFYGCIYFNINAVLKFLQVLNLDLLVIHDWSDGDWQEAYQMYHLIDDLVKTGSGWRELVVMSNFCMGLGTRYSTNSIRNAQPSYWRAVLNVRGDQDASVNILQRKKPGGPFKPLRRKVARMWDSQDFAGLETSSKETIDSWKRACNRETMVVIRRGDNADVSNQGLVILENPKQDIGRWFAGKSWDEIRLKWRE